MRPVLRQTTSPEHDWRGFYQSLSDLRGSNKLQPPLAFLSHRNPENQSQDYKTVACPPTTTTCREKTKYARETVRPWQLQQTVNTAELLARSALKASLSQLLIQTTSFLAFNKVTWWKIKKKKTPWREKTSEPRQNGWNDHTGNLKTGEPIEDIHFWYSISDSNFSFVILSLLTSFVLSCTSSTFSLRAPTRLILVVLNSQCDHSNNSAVVHQSVDIAQRISGLEEIPIRTSITETHKGKSERHKMHKNCGTITKV